MRFLKGCILITLIIFIGCSIGYCSGYLFKLQGGRANAMAGAFVATADDASAIFYNPAGMGFLHNQQLLLGANIYYQKGSLDGVNPLTNANISENLRASNFIVPATYYVKPINDKFTAGIGLFRRYNYDTEWEESSKYAGRFISQRTYLSTWSINPSLAYQFSSKLSVGAGIEIVEIKFGHEKNIPLLIHQYDAIFDVAHLSIESKSEWGFAFNVGAIYLLRDDIKVGFSYRHGVKKDLDAQANFDVLPISSVPLSENGGPSFPQETVAVQTNVFLPSNLNFGASYKYDETLTIELDLGWEKWDDMKEIKFNFADYPIYNFSISKDYNNCFNIHLGAEKIIDDTYRIQAGYAFEKSPVDSGNADLLYWDGNRHNLSFGLTIVKEKIAMSIYNSFLFHQKINVNEAKESAFNGSYKKFINVLGIAFNYNW